MLLCAHMKYELHYHLMPGQDVGAGKRCTSYCNRNVELLDEPVTAGPMRLSSHNANEAGVVFLLIQRAVPWTCRRPHTLLNSSHLLGMHREQKFAQLCCSAWGHPYVYRPAIYNAGITLS